MRLEAIRRRDRVVKGGWAVPDSLLAPLLAQLRQHPDLDGLHLWSVQHLGLLEAEDRDADPISATNCAPQRMLVHRPWSQWGIDDDARCITRRLGDAPCITEAPTTNGRARVGRAGDEPARDRDSTAVMHRASPVGCPAHLARRRDLSPSHPLAAWNRLCHSSVMHRASPRASTTNPRASVKQAMSWPDRDFTAVMHSASRVRLDLASIRWIDPTRAGVVYALGDARCIT